MTTVHDTRALYNSLSARISTETSKPVGDAVRPPGANPPYSVLYPSFNARTDGTLTDPNQIVVHTFIVHCVGKTMDEAQELQFGVRSALQGHSPAVAGWVTGPIELDFGSGIARDDDGTSPVFYSTDRFRVYIS
jgi:hypothetical protein